MISKRIVSTFGKLRRGRLILLFIICVLLPTMPLAYLALRSRVGESESISGEINNHLKRVGLAFAATAAAGLSDCESDIDDRLGEDLPLNEAVVEIAEEVNVCSVFGSFFILDSRMEILYPFGRRMAGEEVPEIGAAGEKKDKFASGMKEGCKKEFASRDPEGAIGDYRLALAGTEGGGYRAVAENAVARCYFKLGKYREAQKHYREILSRGGGDVFYGDLSLNLLAMYQLAVIDGMMGNKEGAAGIFLNIMKALAGGELAGSVYEAAFYASMTEENMDELLGPGEADRQYLSEFEELQERWRRMKKAALEIGEIRGDAAREFKEIMEEGGEGALRFRTISLDGDGRETILLARRLAGEMPGGPFILAVVLDPGALRKEIGEALRNMLKSEMDVNAAVYDSMGNTVAEGGDKASSSRYELPFDLAPALPSWVLEVSYRKEGLLFEVASKERMTRLTSIFFFLAVIFLGLYVTYRSIKRDTELARLKSDFVSRVSHELRTPLATIRAVGEMLEMGAVSSREKEEQYFSLIASESERLSRLIDNVLDFSKIGTDRKTYSFKHADIGKTVSSTIQAFRQYVKSEGFDVVFNEDGDTAPISIDEDAISQALINLMDNAVKFSRDEKVVRVELRRRGDEVVISVKDRGIGIAQEDLGKIFDQFYRPREATELSGKGAGIGLAIVKHVAEAHGGRVEVQSTKGEGSVFSLVLPAAGAAS